MLSREDLEFRIHELNKRLEPFLPKEEGLQRTVIEAMNYSLLAGGKRIRPMILVETFRMFHGNSAAVDYFMAAIEMIHTYSLVHDDLPAMDNDEFRRGKKTTHAAYGEAMGILAGDGLLNYAFETAIRSFEVEEDSSKIIKALRILSQKAGIYGMIGGQVVDVEEESKENSMTAQKLDFIYRMKTSALIEASMMIGAVLADATEEQVLTVEQIATKVGVAFQIQDDILDIIGTEEVLGKPVGSDEKNQKNTYVQLEGIEKAKDDVEKLSKEAIQLLDSYDAESDFLKDLFLYLIYREY